VATTDKAT